ncbi:RWP-RK domain-containing protein [Balamuthia mandrillaris]
MQLLNSEDMVGNMDCSQSGSSNKVIAPHFEKEEQHRFVESLHLPWVDQHPHQHQQHRPEETGSFVTESNRVPSSEGYACHSPSSAPGYSTSYEAFSSANGSQPATLNTNGAPSSPSSSSSSGSLSIVPTTRKQQAPDGKTYVDITPYMTMPQAQAAKTLGIPSSTLSKRWREAARARKWPWRIVAKLDKEITTLLYNVPPGSKVPPEVEERLAYLMRQREKKLEPVIIRI